eukprot:COSAG01_NODE_64676_length_275_cov_4.988636_1_plen_37_part_10
MLAGTARAFIYVHVAVALPTSHSEIRTLTLQDSARAR